MVIMTITYNCLNHTPFASFRLQYEGYPVHFLINLDGSSDIVWGGDSND